MASYGAGNDSDEDADLENPSCLKPTITNLGNPN